MDNDRLTRLEERVRRLEDELDITRLIASYGPYVDTGAAEAVADLWVEDGEYDVEGWHMRSRADIRAMVESDAHQSLISAGCSHFLGPAHVVIDGDHAVAVCESLLVRHREGHFRVWRAGANRFELVRTPRVVRRVTHRTTRALDGTPEARRLLEANVPDADAT
ncbi:nuclear transport factor 2 family protein [Nocardia brevicatena]|uniref:nuclear transport factor 2 family protein n=1 Tax=Nocardia brevicatena TaxID=37327 RepID=UPI0003129EF1|nr:nuclear transport factor 2 family protein [Nocardia brevicatena]